MNAKKYLVDAFDKLRILHQSEKTEIWLVMDHQDQRIYVLKIIARQGLSYGKLVALNHQGIPDVRYVCEEGEYTYVVEEYLQGQTLAQYLKEKGHLKEKQVKDIVMELCDCLKFLHSYKIIHRDIKPSNIFLTEDGKFKLIDFDAARIKKENQQADTVCLGTEGFAAPEQYGSRPTDERSDIYSLGVTMKALLGDDYFGSLVGIIDKCTEFDAKHRFQDADALKTALQSSAITIKKKLWQRTFYYHIYHLQPFLFIIGIIYLMLSMAYPVDWHRYEEIMLHIEIWGVVCFGYLLLRQKKLSKEKDKLQYISSPDKDMKLWKKILWNIWHYIIWVVVLVILISGLGISYSRSWEKLICQMVIVLPPFLAYFSFQWKLIKDRLRD